MRRWIGLFFLAVFLASSVSCATRGDIARLEGKVNSIQETLNRSALEEIFGAQAEVISRQIMELDETQRAEFSELQRQFRQGHATVEQVRESMLALLGGDDRVVSTPRGIYLRTLEGTRAFAVPRGTRIRECRHMGEQDLPPPILESPALRSLSWGRGTYNNAPFLFPWGFTISGFASEVAEATSQRTAEQFVRMGGEKGWSRPIQIQVSTPDTDRLVITTEETEAQIDVVPYEQKK